MPVYKFQKFNIFADGDTKITKDAYDQDMVIINPRKALGALKADQKGLTAPYRRFSMAMALLDAAITSFPDGDLRVVTYGH